MQRTRDIVSTLLAVDRRKGSAEEKRIRAFPALLGFINLLFCAFMEQFLRQDVGGHYLSLLLFAESSMIVLIAVGSFSRNGMEVLCKTSIFPTTKWSRLLYVFMSSLRKPATLALLVTTVIFFVVLFSSSFVIAGFALLFYLLLVLNVLVMSAAVCVKLTTASQPIAGFIAISVFAIIVVLVSSMVFHFNALLASLPVLSWAVDGILAAQSSGTVTALLSVFYLMSSLAASLLIAKRFAQ